MVNDVKPSGNEAEDVTLLLETNEMPIITKWIAPNIIYKAQIYFHTGSEELASSKGCFLFKWSLAELAQGTFTSLSHDCSYWL